MKSLHIIEKEKSGAVKSVLSVPFPMALYTLLIAICSNQHSPMVYTAKVYILRFIIKLQHIEVAVQSLAS